jgi:hypothetical protein
MIEVEVRPMREIDASTFEGVVDAPYVGMRDHDKFGWIWLLFDTTTPFTAAELAAIRDRTGSENSNDEVLRQRARQALQNNRDYLQVTNPDAAAVRAQVEALTRQVNALIRMALKELDGTE